jgi:required for meiotic nuclear division protein 1
MASRNATWAAFSDIVRGSLYTTNRYSHYRPTLLHPPHFRALTTTPCRQRDPVKATAPPSSLPRRQTARTIAPSSPTPSRKREGTRKVIHGSGLRAHVNPDLDTKDVTAYCAAETYDVEAVREILKRQGCLIDPLNTGLYPQVLHVQIENVRDGGNGVGERQTKGLGDVFIFPSGTVVTWNVPDAAGRRVVEGWLPAAAVGESEGGTGQLKEIEVEDMQYLEDPDREHSKVVGDTIILGTRASNAHSTSTEADGLGQTQQQRPETDTILAKIAVSSALSRSTKLAVLESLLNSYFATTRSIPTTLSAGSKLKFSRPFILKKTGELLSIRAQLNLYSELTDSLPDLFWDTPHELGLENYYDQVGSALDVGIRIKTLNEKMDYAAEIAAVLRERLSEKHSTELEWYIIGLIMIEVAFGIYTLSKETLESIDPNSTENLMREYLRRELGREGP